MEGFAIVDRRRSPARPYMLIFVCFFLLILFSNWAGLMPIVGRVDFLRAPTSDVNVTIGLAIVAFVMFEIEGFRTLGARKYLAKFFPIYEFKNGIGAGLIAMFVGITEFLLDLVRPLTLSMRLFGNIYGGEVALGVITALTVVILPVLLLGLEFMLNLIQALIFSILALMYIVLAIEDHGDEEGHMAAEAVAELEGHPLPAGRHHAGRAGHQSCEFNGARKCAARSNQHLASLPHKEERRQHGAHWRRSRRDGRHRPRHRHRHPGRHGCRRDRPQPGRCGRDPRSGDHPRRVR